MSSILEVDYIPSMLHTMADFYKVGNMGMYNRIKDVCVLHLNKVHRHLPNILYGSMIDNEVQNIIYQDRLNADKSLERFKFRK